MSVNKKYLALILLLSFSLIFTGCAPGNERWDREINPDSVAGFWAGAWHGLIIVVTFIVSLFTEDVGLYEINNTGWPYNLGFLIGIFIFTGIFRAKRARRKVSKYEWKKLGDNIEEKVYKGLKKWVEEGEEEEKEKWEEIAGKIEEKIKKELSEWLGEE